jgi:hypothetical protein
MSEAINRLGDAKNFVSLGYTHSALMAIDDAIKILQAAQAQVSDEVLAELDKLSNRNYELRMENTDLKSKLQGIPVAVRFGWDGEGYQYMDNGSGSDWKTRIPDAELLYAHPQPARKCSECGNGEPDLSLYCVRCLNNDGWYLTDDAQAQAVNQKLLAALQKAESHMHAMMAHIDHKPRRFQEHCWQQVLDIRAAIAAAQEGE